MIPMIEIQPGVLLNAMHLLHFRVVDKKTETQEMPAGVYYQLRDMGADQWMKVHPACESYVRELIPFLIIRPLRQDQILMATGMKPN